MTQEAEILFQAALRLPDELRVELAERLLQSVDPDDSVDPQWEAELVRRSEELESGADGGMDWTELRNER